MTPTSKALLVVSVASVFTLMGCTRSPEVYQATRSDDGRCAFTITEEDDTKEGVFATHRLLYLRIVMDGKEVMPQQWFGGKRWQGNELQFTVTKADRFYCLSAIGEPDYALAAVDADTGAVWYGSTNPKTEHIKAAFSKDGTTPELTDLNWLVSNRPKK